MKIIAAVDEKWGIGKGMNLLFRISEDMEFFKEKTMGKTVVMEIGRASCRERV